ncbi:MAG: tRNA 2-thiouridine synthesizing protein C [Pseudohongiellaceae bacterium]|jgi:tRNA 2-thiouridine synthesizing protein C
MSKKILIHCRQSPYGNSLSREAIDIALASAAFDQDICLLFSSDGVFQLNSQQASESLESKNHGKAVSALPLYGVDHIYVCSDSLIKRQLQAEQLIITATQQSYDQIAQLLNNQDVILNF